MICWKNGSGLNLEAWPGDRSWHGNILGVNVNDIGMSVSLYYVFGRAESI